MRAQAHLPVHTGPEVFVPQCVHWCSDTSPEVFVPQCVHWCSDTSPEVFVPQRVHWCSDTSPEVFVPQCVHWCSDSSLQGSSMHFDSAALSLVINECALLQILKSVFGIHQNFRSVAFI